MWAVQHLLSSLAPVRRMNEPWVLTRTACFGNDILQSTRLPLRQHRAQKLRAELLVSLVPKLDRTISPSIPIWVFGILNRRDVFPLIVQQNLRISPKSPAPKFIFIDTFSDLTDQAFKHAARGFQFFSHYSDLNQERFGLAGIEPQGLLDLDLLDGLYEEFILSSRKVWGEVPIFFLTYPLGLETREEYRNRALKIQKILQGLSQRHDSVIFLDFTDAPVSPAPHDLLKNEVFPYHYNPEFYQRATESSTIAINTAIGKKGT